MHANVGKSKFKLKHKLAMMIVYETEPSVEEDHPSFKHDHEISNEVMSENSSLGDCYIPIKTTKVGSSSNQKKKKKLIHPISHKAI